MSAAATATSVLLAAGDSKPLIDWAALGKVAGVSLLFGLAVVVLFSVGIVGLSMARGHDVIEAPHDPAGAPVAALGAQNRRVVGSALAGVCFVACGAAVLYGLYLIVPQFH
ncbi:hypothetical protein SAMN05443575_1704 [Jatrophihabitans endophyticus]|uniref:Uncharacterized protein n=1 Tax=Jatrophihabitans endophyticus TaxID=1206085 RepID=A0A1M5I0N7_9ACTN|nr:hypothetical protein [Jatrophihabitans endophyticus]SHG21610.1 hypothetical protein SAMN05443575_1704 [Jatrophihabitans endophyticus]